MLLLASRVALAHGEPHAAAAAPAAVSAAAEEAPAAPAAPVEAGEPAAPVEPAAVAAPAELARVAITPGALAHHATSHLHNKLVHLPVGLALGLVALAVLRGPLLPGQVLAAIGALSALASLYTGTVQGDAYAREVPAMRDVVAAHRACGWVATVAWALAAGAWFFPGGGRGMRIGGSALALAGVGAAGLLGGWLAAG